MHQERQKQHKMTRRRWAALTAALAVMTPLAATPVAAAAQLPGMGGGAQRPGMSTRKKLVALGGAALLYYLYKRHTANRANQAAPTGGAMGTTGAMGAGTRPMNARSPQLYRSKNGGVYYRNPQGQPVWLTVPRQAVQVPADDLQRYAPDYNQYRGPAPSAPAGYRTQTFDTFEPGVFGGNTMAPAGSGGPMRGTPPGPRGS